MKKKNKVVVSIFSIALSGISTTINAQLSDSIKTTQKNVLRKINDEFPTTRFLDLQYDGLGEYKYTTKIDDKEYETGKIKSQKRLKLAMNYPLIQKNNWELSTSARYKYEHLSFEDVNVPSGGVPVITGDKNADFHYLWASINYTRYGKLWGKTFISNITVSTDASNKNYGMVYGSYIGSLVLKRNENTTLTVGLVLQSNANSLLPVLPSFAYSHKFKDSPWTMDIILPKQIYLRRQLLAHGRLSIGSELESNPYYFKSDFFTDKDKYYMFNRNEFRNGVTYEYRLSKSFIGYAKTGYVKSLNGIVREKYKSDKLSTTNYDGNFYFNFGLSFNPLK